MEIFVNIVNDLKQLTIFAKKLPPRCLIGSNYASGIIIICNFFFKFIPLSSSLEPCVLSPEAILKNKPLICVCVCVYIYLLYFVFVLFICFLLTFLLGVTLQFFIYIYFLYIYGPFQKFQTWHLKDRMLILCV